MDEWQLWSNPFDDMTCGNVPFAARRACHPICLNIVQPTSLNLENLVGRLSVLLPQHARQLSLVADAQLEIYRS